MPICSSIICRVPTTVVVLVDRRFLGKCQRVGEGNLASLISGNYKHSQDTIPPISLSTYGCEALSSLKAETDIHKTGSRCPILSELRTRFIFGVEAAGEKPEHPDDGFDVPDMAY